MFPLNWNIPFIRKNGSRTTLGDITGDITGIEEDVAGLSTQASSLWNTMGQNGAKNYLPIKIYDLKSWNTVGTWSGNAYTSNGVTFTCTVDSNDNVTNIALTNTATDNAVLNIYGFNGAGGWLPNKYKGLFLIGGISETIRIIAANATDSSGSNRNNCIDEGNGVEIASTEDYTRIYVVVSNGASTGVSLTPMIGIETNMKFDPTYQPYAMTNRELTEELAISDQWADAKVAGISYFSGSYLKKYGAIVTLSFSVSDELPASTDTKVLELPVGCRPAKNFIIPAYINGVANGHAWIKANGDVEISPTTAGTYLGFTTTFIVTQ